MDADINTDAETYSNLYSDVDGNSDDDSGSETNSDDDMYLYTYLVLVICPRAKLEVASLLIKGEIPHVYFT